VQQPGQDLADFGSSVAQSFEPAVKALDGARECVNQSQEKPGDARKEADKALKTVPDHGLASYCLAQLAIRDSAPSGQIIQRLQTAVKGDSLSLPAWTLLAQQYQTTGDTARMLNAFENMLRVAPTNQALREELFRQFLNLGEIDRAKNVADEGLRMDPYNADLYDLKSNACLFASDFGCAVEALEQAYAIDSTRPDTLFFTKIAVAAEQRLLDTTQVATAADSAAFLRWTRTGAQRFPQNPTILGYLAKAYATTGQADSSVTVIRQIAAVDSAAALDAALGAVQSFADAGTIDSAGPVIAYVNERGAVDQKDRLAGLLMQRASQLLQPPTPQYEAAVNLARPAAQMADPNGEYYATANYLFGVAGLQRAAEIDKLAAAEKSCELARDENALLKEAAEALPKGREFNPQTVEQYGGYISQYLTRSEAMVKSFCK
jgi:tetratricopeptide (TPR) repeat protein